MHVLEPCDFTLTEDDVLTLDPELADLVLQANTLAITLPRPIERYQPVRRRASVCPLWVTVAEERVARWLGMDPDEARAYMAADATSIERKPLQVLSEALRDVRRAWSAWSWAVNEFHAPAASRDEANAVIGELRRGFRVHRARVAAAALYVIQEIDVSRETERAARRAKILHVTEELLTKHGVHGTRIQDIAKSSGCAVGTVHSFWPHKEALLTEAACTWLRRWASAWPDDSWRPGAVDFEACFRDSPRIARVFLAAADPAWQEHLDEPTATLLAEVLNLFPESNGGMVRALGTIAAESVLLIGERFKKAEVTS